MIPSYSTSTPGRDLHRPIGVQVPLVEVTLVQGRTPQQLRALLHELHDAVVRSIGAPAESVRVVIREVPATHWAAGDVTIAERRVAAPHGKLDDG